jgi:hypothetical protein
VFYVVVRWLTDRSGEEKVLAVAKLREIMHDDHAGAVHADGHTGVQLKPDHKSS